MGVISLILLYNIIPSSLSSTVLEIDIALSKPSFHFGVIFNFTSNDHLNPSPEGIEQLRVLWVLLTLVLLLW